MRTSNTAGHMYICGDLVVILGTGRPLKDRSPHPVFSILNFKYFKNEWGICARWALLGKSLWRVFWTPQNKKEMLKKTQ